jgi:drug/metabolite transporter (DMT)-like permease
MLLIAAGMFGYTLAQGLQYVGLFYLPAVTTTFILNFTPIFVLVLGILFLNEQVSRIQLLGLPVALLGATLFFSKALGGEGQVFGILVVLVSGLAWALYLIIIRRIQSVNSFGSFKLTALTMGTGTAGLLLLAAVFEGPAPISTNGILILLWLSVVNTALAFLLWNRVLRHIQAYRLSMIQNSMLVQVAVLAWIFLGERLTYLMVLGMIFVIVGVVLVQLPGINGSND